MSGLPLILAHLLFIYALVAEPILGVRMYRTLKHSPPRDDEALVRFYRRGIASEWLWVLWIGVILVSSGVSLEAIGLVWTDEVSRSLLMFGGAFALGSAVAIAVLVLRARAAGDPGIRASLEQMLEPVSAFLPSTRKERWLFAGLSITAGICEEILFRGFLIFYLSEVFPGLPVVGAVIASSLIFGLWPICTRGLKACLRRACSAPSSRFCT